METISFISELLEISQICNLTFDEIFIIAIDNGLIDEFGNISFEVLSNNKGVELIS